MRHSNGENVETFMKEQIFTKEWSGIKETNIKWLKHSEASNSRKPLAALCLKGKGMERYWN